MPCKLLKSQFRGFRPHFLTEPDVALRNDGQAGVYMVSEIAPSLHLIAYERILTTRQGTIGRGREAQRISIGNLAASHGAKANSRFTEAESGKTSDRPDLRNVHTR